MRLGAADNRHQMEGAAQVQAKGDHGDVLRRSPVAASPCAVVMPPHHTADPCPLPPHHTADPCPLLLPPGCQPQHPEQRTPPPRPPQH